MTDKRRLLGIEELFELGRQRTVSQQILILPPLTKPPGYYLTSDEGSECEQISDVELLLSRDTFRWQTSGDIGVDLKEFKKQCEEIERGE